MRNHKSFTKQTVPAGKSVAKEIEENLTEARRILSEARSKAEVQPVLDLNALEIIVSDIQKLVSKPRQIGIKINRSKNGNIVSMIGTTDPAEVAMIEAKDGDQIYKM